MKISLELLTNNSFQNFFVYQDWRKATGKETLKSVHTVSEGLLCLDIDSP